MGAWIEIGFRLYLSCSIGVAPLVGAWIEMMLSPKRFPEPVVAPLVGAWIEISKGMSASEWIKMCIRDRSRERTGLGNGCLPET